MVKILIYIDKLIFISSKQKKKNVLHNIGLTALNTHIFDLGKTIFIIKLLRMYKLNLKKINK